jgi:hypothetical protein
LRGNQEVQIFRGIFDRYRYLPLCIFGRDHLLNAKLKSAYLDPGNEALPDPWGGNA